MTNQHSETTHELFVFLGSSHEQRYEAIWQMVDYLHYHGDKVVLCVHESEQGLPDSKSKDRAISKGLEITTWSIDEEKATFTQPPPELEEKCVVLFVGHGKELLVDTLEALSLWLPESDYELQRIITWVDSLLYRDNPNAQNWYNCCYHFSDLVIFDLFKDLPLSWLKEMKDFFKTQCYPCIIENTKKGRLQNINVILDNQVRRISQVFENPIKPYVEYEIEGDEEDDEEAEENLEKPISELYFERLIDGKRSKPVPEV